MSGDDIMSADGLGWDPSRVLFPEFTAGSFLSEASRDSEGFYRSLLHTALVGEEPSLEQIALALSQLPEGSSPRLLLLKAHLRQLCRLGAEIGDRLEEHGLGGASGYLEPEPAMLLVNEVLHHHFGESTLESLEVVHPDAPHQEDELAILELDQSVPEGFPLPLRSQHPGPEPIVEEGNRVRTETDALSQSTHFKREASPGRPSDARADASLQSDAFDAPLERREQARLLKEAGRPGSTPVRRAQSPTHPPWLEALPDTGPDPWIEAATSTELTPGPSERPRKPVASKVAGADTLPQPPSALPLPPPSPLSDREAHALWNALSSPEDEAALAMFPSLPAPPPRQRAPRRTADPAATWEHGAEPLPAEWQRSMEELAFEPQQGEHPPLPPTPTPQQDAIPSEDRRAATAPAPTAPTRRALPQGARPTQTSSPLAGTEDSGLELPLPDHSSPPPSGDIHVAAPTDLSEDTAQSSLDAAAPPTALEPRRDTERTLEMDYPEDLLPSTSEPSRTSEAGVEGISLPIRSEFLEWTLNRTEALGHGGGPDAAKRSSLSEGTDRALEAHALEEEAPALSHTRLPPASQPHTSLLPNLEADTRVTADVDASRGPQSGLEVLHYFQEDHSINSSKAGEAAGAAEGAAEQGEGAPVPLPSLAVSVLERLGTAPQAELEDLLWDAGAILGDAAEDDVGAHALLMVLTRLGKAQQLTTRLQQDLAASAEQVRTLETRLAQAEEEKRDTLTRLQTAEARLSRVSRQDAERSELEAKEVQQVQTLDRAETLLDQLFYADLIDWTAVGEDAFPARPALAEKFSRLGETLESWRSMAEQHTEQVEGLKAELSELKELVTDKEHLILSQDRQLAERDELLQAQNGRFKRQLGETGRFKILALWQNARVQILELRRKVESAMAARGMFGRRKMPEPPQMRELVMAMDHIEEVLSRLQGRMDPSDFQVAEPDLEYLRKFTGAFRRYLEKTGNPVTRPPASGKRAAATIESSKDEPVVASHATEDGPQSEESFPEPKAIDLTAPVPESGSTSEEGELRDSAQPPSDSPAASADSDSPPPSSELKAEAVS